MQQIRSDYTYEDFVWCYERNEELLTNLTAKDKEKREAEYPLTGSFLLDYIRQCKVLGILPHPSIASTPIILHSSPIPQPPSNPSKARRRPNPERPRTEPLPPSPECVSIRHWRIDYPSLLALDLTLTPSKSIHTLTLVDCGLSVRDLTLLTAMVEDSSLQKLTLDFSPLPLDASPTSLPIRPLSQEPRLQPLTHILDTPLQSPSDAPLMTILGTSPITTIWSRLLSPSSPLQVLSLRANNLSDIDALSIAQALAVNKTLLMLDVSMNNITDDAAQCFAEALLLNKTLAILNLAQNKLTSSGLRLLLSVFVPMELPKDGLRMAKRHALPTVSSKSGRVYRDCNTALRHLSLANNPCDALNTWVCILETLGAGAMLDQLLTKIISDKSFAASLIDHYSTVSPPVGTHTVTVDGEDSFPLLPPPAPALIAAICSTSPEPCLTLPLYSSIIPNNTFLPPTSLMLPPAASATAVPPTTAARARALGRRASQVSGDMAAAMAAAAASFNVNNRDNSDDGDNDKLNDTISENATENGQSMDDPENLITNGVHFAVLSETLKEREENPSPSALGMDGSRNGLQQIVMLGVKMPLTLKTLLGDVNKLLY